MFGIAGILYTEPVGPVSTTTKSMQETGITWTYVKQPIAIAPLYINFHAIICFRVKEPHQMKLWIKDG